MLSHQQKIEAYSYAIEYVSKTTYNCICYGLIRYLESKGMVVFKRDPEEGELIEDEICGDLLNEVPKYFPEFILFNPSGQGPSDFNLPWFSYTYDGQQKRLQLLEKLISNATAIPIKEN